MGNVENDWWWRVYLDQGLTHCTISTWPDNNIPSHTVAWELLAWIRDGMTVFRLEHSTTHASYDHITPGHIYTGYQYSTMHDKATVTEYYIYSITLDTRARYACTTLPWQNSLYSYDVNGIVWCLISELEWGQCRCLMLYYWITEAKFVSWHIRHDHLEEYWNYVKQNVSL